MLVVFHTVNDEKNGGSAQDCLWFIALFCCVMVAIWVQKDKGISSVG
jgi:hypothetical protein